MKIEKILTILFIAFVVIWSLEIATRKIEEEAALKKEKQISGSTIVSDGDTIKIDEKRIRLLRIDAPETKQECFDENDKKYLCGEVSTNFLRKFIGEKNVVCFYEKLDIYNRYLAECFVDGISINEAMIKQGMAIIYDFGQTNQRMLAMQDEAKRNARGIWRGKFERPQDYRRRKRGK